jgi:hypothetical protein
LLIEQVWLMGVASFPLVLVISVFIGAVTAVQARYQFHGLIPDTYLGTAIAKFVIIESGPVLTALVLAGRVGAAIAAEIGTLTADAEQKKTAVAETVEPALFRQDAEKSLFTTVNQAEKQAGEAIQKEDFSAAMLALSVLREPVDSFFERVLVNDEDQAVRANRLALLARIRAATDQVADFSRIAG